MRLLVYHVDMGLPQDCCPSRAVKALALRLASAGWCPLLLCLRKSPRSAGRTAVCTGYRSPTAHTLPHLGLIFTAGPAIRAAKGSFDCSRAVCCVVPYRNVHVDCSGFDTRYWGNRTKAQGHFPRSSHAVAKAMGDKRTIRSSKPCGLFVVDMVLEDGVAAGFAFCTFLSSCFQPLHYPERTAQSKPEHVRT